MALSQQEYWSGLPCPPPGDLPDPGIETESFVSYLSRQILYHWGFPGGPAGEESACNAGDLGSISGLGTSPGEENGYLLQHSGLENSMDCIVQGVTTERLSLHFLSLAPPGKPITP